MVWYSHLLKNCPQFVVIHTVKGFGIGNKAEIDIFLELSFFFNNPADVGNLISGSSAFSKTSLNIWTFMVNVLMKPGLENFEHYFTSMRDECNCAVVWRLIPSWGPPISRPHWNLITSINLLIQLSPHWGLQLQQVNLPGTQFSPWCCYQNFGFLCLPALNKRIQR